MFSSRVLLNLQKCIVSGASYKFCISSVIPGNLSPFEIKSGRASVLISRKCQVKSVTRFKVRIFLIPLSITFLIIFDSDNFRFSFFHEKKCLSWGVKCEKSNLRKSQGNLLDKVPKLLINGTWSLEIFILPQVIENSRQYLLFRTDICRKQSLGAPASAAQEHNPRFCMNKPCRP